MATRCRDPPQSAVVEERRLRACKPNLQKRRLTETARCATIRVLGRSPREPSRPTGRNRRL